MKLFALVFETELKSAKDPPQTTEKFIKLLCWIETDDLVISKPIYCYWMTSKLTFIEKV